MPKISAPLIDNFIKNLKATDKAQKYYDGGGLYLYVSSKSGDKFWYMSYWWSDKQKTLSIEKKEDIKERTGCSLNLADALALTFAMPVLPEVRQRQMYADTGLSQYGVFGEDDYYYDNYNPRRQKYADGAVPSFFSLRD